MEFPFILLNGPLKHSLLLNCSSFSICVFLYLRLKTIVEERDQERERRWKAEQAVRKLTEDLKCLQTKVSEEKDLQSMALHTTDR